jgi:hypothetical protein
MVVLALTPMLLHAQESSPVRSQSSTLQSKLIPPTKLSGPADPSHNVTPTSPSSRISSGVVAPKLVYTVDIPTEGNLSWKLTKTSRTVVVGMLVDEKGIPSNLKIVRSLGESMDKDVLAAVSQYRFRPGTLDQQPASVPVELQIEIVGTRR